MEIILVNFASVSLILVPVVVALTQIVKMWVLDARYAPLASIVFGGLLSFVSPQDTVILTLFQGLLFGLIASGLYDVGMKTIAGK